MLNLVIQKGGAHTQTIPLFVEMLLQDCHVFYTTNDTTVSYEAEIKARYATQFIKTLTALNEIVGNAAEHGLLIFNTASERQEDWAQPLIQSWRGRVAVYHHDMSRLNDGDMIEFYAHPFADTDLYLAPVSGIFADQPMQAALHRRATIVVPNWSRPSQLANKNMRLLSDLLEAADPDRLRFVMTGMSADVMNTALGHLKSSSKIEVIHRPDVAALGDLLKRQHTYVLPLIHPTGRYARQGLTFSIPMALNYSCPVIVSRDIARAYEVEVFVDEDRILSDLPGSDDDYRALANATAADRQTIIDRNHRRFDAICADRSCA